MNVEEFFRQQLSVWADARQRYESLSEARHKTVVISGRDYDVVYNPARLKSATARVEGGRVERPCFLCPDALPKEQIKSEIEVRPSGRKYWLMVNPYPITDRHFTIVSQQHQRQTLLDEADASADGGAESKVRRMPAAFRQRLWDMAFLADLMPDYLIFFNGACSGASAPDHMHFQAVPKDSVPLTRWTWQQQQDMGVTSRMPQMQTSADSDYKNVICWTDGTDCHWLTIDRKAHRPRQYAMEGEEQVLMSPAALEYCGLVPLARKDDFDRMDAALLRDILGQCRRQEPVLHVGVMEGKQIRLSAGERTHALNYLGEDRILHVMDYGTDRAEQHETDEYHTESSPFTLEGVTIGKQFHWEQREDQTFVGSLRVIAREGTLHAINILPVEEYLKSVISSEMSATNCLELLKAHAVISRSWVLRQIDKSGEQPQSAAEHSLLSMSPASPADKTPAGADSVPTVIKYWDHDDHVLYDVCADDHCQRYQGITRQVSPLVAQAIEETRGMVLLAADGSICDARFSKCCGGRTELFSACWQDRDYDYLQCVDDPWCDTHDAAVLRLVLNDYDQRTVDFHDWQVRYTQSELSDLVRRRLLGEFPDPESDIHKQISVLGTIVALRPVRRGPSGRISLLEIEGEGGTLRIGKELLIRKALSESHLYSSAFDVTMEDDASTGAPVFVLTGRGWGHGVGLCQIGAANMSQHGKTCEEILSHYFSVARLVRIY